MQLQANGIDLPASVPFSMRFYNPLFNDIGSFSFPLTFNGKDPQVQKAFGFPSLSGNNGSITPEGRLKLGTIEISGRWRVLKAGDVIEACFTAGNGDFYSLIKGKSLRDLEYGGVRYPAGAYAGQAELCAYADTIVDAVYPDNDFTCYPSYMPNAFGTNTTEAQKMVNAYDVVGETFTYVNSFYLFVGRVIDYLFEEHGYRVDYNIFREDADLRKVTIFNTCQVPFSFGALYYSDLLPDITCSDFIKAIRNRFNLSFVIDEIKKSVRVVSFNDIIKKNPARVNFSTRVGIDKNRITGVTLGLLPPDDWASHDIGSEEDFDPFTFEEKDKVRDIVVSALYNNHVYWVKAESAIYRVLFDGSVYTLNRICPNLFSHSEGIDETPIEQLSGILSLYTHTVEIDYTYWVGEDEFPESTDVDFILPRCDLIGINDDYNQEDFPLMFLSYLGMQNNYVVPNTHSYQTDYPLASVDVYDATGTKITTANLSLRWDSSYGLIEKFWENRIDWELNRVEITSVDNLPGDHLQTLLDHTAPIMLGNDKYLVNSFLLESIGKQSRITEVELYRL